MKGTGTRVRRKNSELSDPDYTGTLDTMDAYDDKGDGDVVIIDGKVVDKKKQRAEKKRREEAEAQQKVSF